ncbi:biopolymer transport protein ExbB [Prosthecobacter debontii]|uniref:Biopolymer transport protein ExbB n=1 Tax=Prosthecobacter debontii TaxID=48467 RepID=A0A1T4XQS6_9BACT|nr:MotA/TolQ/ExbB proton channel family protein [Prosthecobacter debontii]SKA91890.1 biopolymer transport protein ExbB [Prosthecobacter debontii]
MLPNPPLANVVIKLIHDGGPIMYPILVVVVFAICILVERIFWWLRFSARRDARQLDQVYAALESGDLNKAISISEKTADPVVRMIHHGLKHQHSSMQGALEVAAGHELQQAGRFLGAMDTVVTLGPLLGLLGTVTGIMGSFSSIGDSELAVEKVTGGIGEALIATAAGLGIAITTLVPMNYFHSRLAKLQFDLEAAANNVLIIAAQHGFDKVGKQ